MLSSLLSLNDDGTSYSLRRPSVLHHWPDRTGAWPVYCSCLCRPVHRFFAVCKRKDPRRHSSKNIVYSVLQGLPITDMPPCSSTFGSVLWDRFSNSGPCCRSIYHHTQELESCCSRRRLRATRATQYFLCAHTWQVTNKIPSAPSHI